MCEHESLGTVKCSVKEGTSSARYKVQCRGLVREILAFLCVTLLLCVEVCVLVKTQTYH